MEKYLYFSGDPKRSETETQTVDNTNVQKIRISDGGIFADVSDFAAGSDLFTSGAVVIDLTFHAGMQLGSHYGTGQAAGDLIRINSKALTYDGTQDITVTTKASDPVFGITMDATATNNASVVKQVKPIFEGDAIVLPASRLLGVVMKDANETHIKFKAHTNDGFGAVDVVTLTHANDKFKEISELVRDAITNERNQKGMVVFADEFNGVYYKGNPFGITNVALNLDSLTTE